ncbi:MAG TPA: UDP-N-acetylmuramate dehydrogenase [Bacteroidota bacterium]|nr:UDP-N-acetylmuramate dehydrogenase [Bacteroidota bacterium]
MINVEEIRKFFRGRFVVNEPLEKYTSFRIGGPADFYLEPADQQDLIAVVKFLNSHSMEFTIMGNGSNLLISDDGIRGVVINFESGLNGLRLEGDRIIAEAGVRIAKFVDFCIQNSRQGAEMLAGIPGTIGGAVVMNAGAYGGEIADHIAEVRVLRGGVVTTVTKADAEFAYRTSAFRKDVVLEGIFELPKGDKAELERRRRELLLKRNESQPVNLPNSGSVFKNPPGTYAAKLVEEAGLKGVRAGNAQISSKHGNFIVNTGGAKASDVIELMLMARTAVLEKFHVKLEPEVHLMGFPKEVYDHLYN